MPALCACTDSRYEIFAVQDSKEGGNGVRKVKGGFYWEDAAVTAHVSSAVYFAGANLYFQWRTLKFRRSFLVGFAD